AEVADPPAVIPHPCPIAQLPLELAPGDLLAELDRLEHRAVAGAAAADVVDGCDARALAELVEGGDEIGTVDVVAHLLAAVAEDGVGPRGDDAAHQVSEEAVQLGAGVVRPRQAAAAEADRRNVE